MNRVAVLFTGAMGAVCAAYTVIYLVRWEWNRALIAAMFFVAVEIVMLGALVYERLRRLDARLDALDQRIGDGLTGRDDPTLGVLRETAPELPDRFRWLRDRIGSTNVFLPILLGAGVVASGLAWIVEHLARATVTASLERRLASRLGAITPPRAGLLGPSVPAPDPLPVRRWTDVVRTTGVAVLVVLGAVATAFALDFVADRTQSRKEPAAADVATVVELELRGAAAARDPHRILGHLWSTCTEPGVIPGPGLPIPDITMLPGGVARVAVDADLPSNYADRLRGCLNDTTITRVQARVISITSS